MVAWRAGVWRSKDKLRCGLPGDRIPLVLLPWGIFLSPPPISSQEAEPAVLWDSLHIYMDSEKSHVDAYAGVAKAFTAEPSPQVGIRTGNTELWLTNLSLLYSRRKDDKTNLTRSQFAQLHQLASLFYALMSLVMNASEHLIDQGPQNQHNTHAI